jgi:peptide/nickel transport system substrate-binding protein
MRQMSRRELFAGLLASGLTSCAGSSRRQDDRSTVAVLYRGEDETAFGPADDMPAKFLVFMRLAAWNRHGALEPRLAETWQYSEDRRACTIRLREGIRWHDGVPVTAHDMKFTLDLLQHPDVVQFAPGSYNVRLLDDRTYVIHYDRIDPTNEGGALDDYIACWPKHLLKDLDPKQINAWDFWSHPVGCGPYRHVRTVPKTMMEFEADPNYYRGKAKINRVILKFGESTSIPELISRSVDAVCYPPRVDLFNVRRYQNFRVHQEVLNAGRAIFWNVRHPFFADMAVRQALTYAIDRSELLQVLNMPNDAHPVDFIRTERQTRRGHFPEPSPYDPELAGRLLNQSGWVLRPGRRLRERGGRPFRFKALVQTSLEGLADSAIYVQDALRRVGVGMDIVTIADGGLVSSRLRSGDFEAVLAGLGTGQLAEALRATGYQNPSFFALLDESMRAFDAEERERLHDELTQIIRKDVPVSFLFPFAVTTIASTRIRGLEDSPYRGDLTYCMDELWLEEV